LDTKPSVYTRIRDVQIELAEIKNLIITNLAIKKVEGAAP
jgi:hypothetical protein